MGDFPALETGEVKLEAGESMLLRNVHPNFYDPGVDKISSQAFRPNSGDGGRMSVYQGSQISAADAYMDYTVEREKASIGVWAVTISEVEDVGSRAVDDQEAGRLARAPLPPGHAYVDFRDLGGSGKREGTRASALRGLASDRKPQHILIE